MQQNQRFSLYSIFTIASATAIASAAAHKQFLIISCSQPSDGLGPYRAQKECLTETTTIRIYFGPALSCTVLASREPVYSRNEHLCTDNTVAAVDAEDKSTDNAETYHALQMEEYNQICNMLKYVQKKDDLDAKISVMFDKMLKKPPPQEVTNFNYNDVSGMKHVLTDVEFVLTPEFSPVLHWPFATKTKAGHTSSQSN